MRLSTALIYQNGLNGILNQESAMSRLNDVQRPPCTEPGR